MDMKGIEIHINKLKTKSQKQIHFLKINSFNSSDSIMIVYQKPVLNPWLRPEYDFQRDNI